MENEILSLEGVAPNSSIEEQKESDNSEERLLKSIILFEMKNQALRDQITSEEIKAMYAFFRRNKNTFIKSFKKRRKEIPISLVSYLWLLTKLKTCAHPFTFLPEEDAEDVVALQYFLGQRSPTTNLSSLLQNNPELFKPQNVEVNPRLIDNFPTQTFSLDSDLKENICGICLSEYQETDTIKTLPSCSHYFHDFCIRKC